MRKNRAAHTIALAGVVTCSVNLAAAAQGDLPEEQGAGNVERQGQETAANTDTGARSTPGTGTAPRATTTPDGIRAGDFLVYPQISLGLTYDDNIYATPQNEVQDTVLHVTPSVEIKSDWQRHLFNVRAGADISRYRDHGSEDTEDYWLEAEGRYDIRKGTNAFGGARYARYHEDRESPDAVLGSDPTLYRDNMVYAGLSHRFNDRFSSRIGGSFRVLDFDDSGLVNNDDRDRNLLTGGVWLGYDLKPGYQLFLQGALDQRNYDSAVDDAGYNRDSDGYRLQAGVKWKRGRLGGDAYLGHMSQRYDDAALADVSAPDYGASLTWRATERTTLRAVLDRSIEETTLSSPTPASSYLATTVSAGVVHRIRPNLTASASASRTNADYQGNSREDDFTAADLGVKYDITRRVFLAAGYRYMFRDSNVSGADFHRNQVSLTLGGYLYPRRPLPPSWETYAFAIDPAVNNRFGGLYLGLQAGHEALGTNTTRDPGTGTDIDDANFLGRDVLWGAFAGYGWTRDRWYAGLELEGERGKAGWDHHKSKANSPTISVDKGNSYGASLRLGRMLDNGVLAYVRGGLVRSDFATRYDNTDATPPDTLVDRTFTETGRRLGVGIEVPETAHLFWRMDYAYTDYGDYVVDYGTAQESYGNVDSALRLGIGYRFGQQLGARSKPVKFDHGGLYAGGYVSQSALGSQTTGTHREDYDAGAMPPGPEYDFAADFGVNDLGAGLFAGYGRMFGNWYLGVEADADFSQAKWEHVRVAGGSPGGGRDFSVAKHDSYGLSGRLGYRLHSGTLVYGRIGAVRTSFQTIYNRGNNSATYVDLRNRVNGRRVGIGADVPMTRDLLLRMDYSYTDYDDYSFTTSHGGGKQDDMNYANWENLFRLGVAMRF